MSLTDSKLTVTTMAKVVSSIGYVFVLVAEAILAIGFLLRLLGANPTAPFTEWSYRNLDRVMAPFRGIFEEVRLDASDSVLDVSILFAMFVYGLVALGLRALVDVLVERSARLEEKRFLEAEALERERRLAARRPAEKRRGPDGDDRDG